MTRANWIWGVMSVCAMALIASPAIGQEKKDDKPKPETKKEDKPKADAKKPAEVKPADKQNAGGQSGEMDMAKMMEIMEKMAAPGPNHKLLEGQVGEWTYVNKCWMDPAAPAQESKGTMTAKSILGGRYVVAEHKGTMPCPGPDGKMVDKEFHGISTTGFDNVKQKFTNSWVDNFSTSIMLSEGAYDAGSKTFTYTSEYEMMPGMKSKIREVIKLVSDDKHLFQWYETRGNEEVMTMEITYTRKK
ncbi:MAG: DUF1579 domain-containing protein [Planctomycetes bacterium]|nr:DUF1579 domain-containing protein [Planctomycetota bacterium]